MKLPIHLAYERSITPSDVAFHVIWPNDDKEPLPCYSRKIVGFNEGAHAGYNSSGSPIKNLAMKTLVDGNIHELDYCPVPYGAKSIECGFSVTFSSELLKPYKCSDANVKKTLFAFIQHYIERIGLNELITRYLTNISNGRWLWRNTKHSYRISIEIQPWPWCESPLIIQDIKTTLINPKLLDELPGWRELINTIEQALTSPFGLCILEVKANLIKPTMAQIYPSQVFKKPIKNENNRVYQSTTIDGIRSPIIGCYKTGAAIATIDTWYPNAEEPIRIGHYGVDRENSTAHRHPNTGKDMFSILKRADEFVELLKGSQTLELETINDMHFLMANLIKGGLFQEKGD